MPMAINMLVSSRMIKGTAKAPSFLGARVNGLVMNTLVNSRMINSMAKVPTHLPMERSISGSSGMDFLTATVRFFIPMVTCTRAHGSKTYGKVVET